uniref:Uncharacterized protein n=1 Tax=Astyanax mexicanus TaxID=7994 RepID=A0A3B1JA85_ASTMX
LSSHLAPKDVEKKGTFTHLVGIPKLVQSLRKTIWKFLENKKNNITIRSRNPTTGDICTPVFMATLFTINVKKCPTFHY